MKPCLLLLLWSLSPFLLQPSFPGTRETLAGAITAVVMEEATVSGSGCLFLIFQNGLHALESQVVCDASFVMYCFKGMKADRPSIVCIASVLLEKEYWTRVSHFLSMCPIEEDKHHYPEIQMDDSGTSKLSWPVLDMWPLSLGGTVQTSQCPSRAWALVRGNRQQWTWVSSGSLPAPASRAGVEWDRWTQ